MVNLDNDYYIDYLLSIVENSCLEMFKPEETMHKAKNPQDILRIFNA